MPGMASFLRIADQQQQTKEARWGLGCSMQAETRLQSRLIVISPYLHRGPLIAAGQDTCSLHGDMASSKSLLHNRGSEFLTLPQSQPFHTGSGYVSSPVQHGFLIG